MSTVTPSWDATSLGSGPIALLAHPAGRAASTTGLLLAASQSSPAVVSIPLECVAAFLERYSTQLFVSENVAEQHRRLLELLGTEQCSRAARDAVWALTRGGRWVDVLLLDRQVRQARDSNDFKMRSWPEILTSWLPDRATESAAKDLKQPSRAENRDSVDDFGRVLAVFERLRTEAVRLEAEAAPVPAPVYELPPLPPEEAEAARVRVHAFVKDTLARRRLSGLDRPNTMESLSGQAETPLPTAPPDPAPLGNGVEVWARVCLGRDHSPGLAVDAARLPAMLMAAEEEYRRASTLLARKPAVRDCFEWSGEEVARNRNGFPQERKKKLAPWLQEAFQGLCDNQCEPADVPRSADGRPSVNPEHWGIWAACDDALWAWRQVYRMAEAARIAGPEATIRPQYETAPAFRSKEPNLAVYRSLGVPVFKPRDGHVFVAGQLPELRARCLAAVCVRRKYVARGQSRLYHYVLQQDKPIVIAAGELYAGPVIASAQRDALADAGYWFSELLNTDPEQYRDWLWRTKALLETAPLGLPGAFLTRLLRNDYGLEGLNEHEVLRLQALLADEVAYELKPFLEDATFDLAMSRLGMTANEGLRQFVNVEHPFTTGARLRNDLTRQLYLYRAVTLGGRVTKRAASAAVRRQEVLMAAEEVMLAVAHDLSAAGYSLLGLTDNEFVLEVPADQTGSEERLQIAHIAKKASRQILGGMAAAVICEAVESW